MNSNLALMTLVKGIDCAILMKFDIQSASSAHGQLNYHKQIKIRFSSWFSLSWLCIYQLLVFLINLSVLISVGRYHDGDSDTSLSGFN